MSGTLFEVQAPSGKRIRLTDTIWRKIRLRHPEFRAPEYLNETRLAVEDPAYVIKGWTTEYLSLRWCTIAPGAPKYLCVVYRELNGDGFIITAFFISRHERLLRREVVWRRS
ncbi:MAG: hypothetical protein HYY01_02195 [Chloroflexi bacterium]|nr:hypothetical protein [Chloroflexota bacterium]